MPYMTRLLPDLKKAFPRVDTVPGWETRGNASFAPAAVVCHWTAGPKATTKRASLNVIVNGRTGLPGPLSQVYLDREGIPVIVAAGRANHAGAGGWKGVTGNSAAYGIEAEAAGPDDWTAAQREAYPRLVAAMLKGLGRGAEWACGHYEWATPTGRKTDIRGWTMNDLRSDVAAILNGEDMPLNAADLAAVRAVVQDEVRAIFDTLTPGRAGVKNDGEVYAMLKTGLDRQVGYGRRIENTEAAVAKLGPDALAKTIRESVASALSGATPGAAPDTDAIADAVAGELALRLAG